MTNKKTYAVGTGAFLLFLMLGSALVGITPVGIHEDCKDGIDNTDPLDGNIDGDDEGCYNYPYEDGNGEETTPPSSRYSGESYSSLFEFHRDYSSDPLESICTAIDFTLYTQPSDLNSANDYINENGPCPQGP